MDDLDPEITRSLNARGSIALARAEKTAGVALFVLLELLDRGPG